MRLRILLEGMVDHLPDDCEVTGLSLQTQTLEPGDVFFAVPGHVVDGRLFIQDAVAKGAGAILYEADHSDDVDIAAIPVPCIAINNLAEKIGSLAAKFYADPSRHLAVIGVTGTNGKSSCVQWLSAALTACGMPCGLVGTLGVGFQQIKPAALTTPDALSVQQCLAEFQQQGAKAVAMEVSSHALVQHRVKGVQFTGAILTQLSRDHLDYHGSMQAYSEAKATLFAHPDLQFAVVNWDDELGQKLYWQHAGRIKMVVYSLHAVEDANVLSVSVKTLRARAQGYVVDIITPWGEGTLMTSVMGRFNVSNQLAVLAALCCLGISLEQALLQLNKSQPVEGRMQCLTEAGYPTVVVDYAHTPDALKQVLVALREHCSGTLWCVFGCGGDRDQGKRAEMGQIAESYADVVVLTNDNPRHESPNAIVDDILQGIDDRAAVSVEMDRALAIKETIAKAAKNDTILIAGKGHEDYQLIGGQRALFSDWQHAKEALVQKEKNA